MENYEKNQIEIGEKFQDELAELLIKYEFNYGLEPFYLAKYMMHYSKLHSFFYFRNYHKMLGSLTSLLTEDLEEMWENFVEKNKEKSKKQIKNKV